MIYIYIYIYGCNKQCMDHKNVNNVNRMCHMTIHTSRQEVHPIDEVVCNLA